MHEKVINVIFMFVQCGFTRLLYLYQYDAVIKASFSIWLVYLSLTPFPNTGRHHSNGRLSAVVASRCGGIKHLKLCMYNSWFGLPHTIPIPKEETIRSYRRIAPATTRYRRSSESWQFSIGYISSIRFWGLLITGTALRGDLHWTTEGCMTQSWACVGGTSVANILNCFVFFRHLCCYGLLSLICICSLQTVKRGLLEYISTLYSWLPVFWPNNRLQFHNLISSPYSKRSLFLSRTHTPRSLAQWGGSYGLHFHMNKFLFSHKWVGQYCLVLILDHSLSVAGEETPLPWRGVMVMCAPRLECHTGNTYWSMHGKGN